MKTKHYFNLKESLKRGSSFVRITAFIVCCLLYYATGASAQVTVNGIMYEVGSNGAQAKGYQVNKPTGALEIPASVLVDGLECPVREIAPMAFSDCNGISSLTLPASIATMGSQAFFNCKSLVIITYNGTTQPQIASDAFIVASETGDDIPARTLNIPNASGGFYASDWGQNITINYGKDVVTHLVTFFHYYGDAGEPIQNVVTAQDDQLLFQPNVPTRPNFTFDGWYTNSNYSATTLFDFAATKVKSSFTLYAKWKAGSQNTYTDANGIIYQIGTQGAKIVGPFYGNFTGALVIPEVVPINGVNCPVREIDNQVFMSTQITSLTLPASMAIIGSGAFLNCNNLTKITYNGRIEPTIGSLAFTNVGSDGDPAKITRTLHVPNASGGFTAEKWGENVTINYGTGGTYHRVTFFHYIDNNNINIQETVDVEEDHFLTRPANPTRAGYTFDGWYTNENYNVAFDFTATKVFSSFTLYAKWVSSGQNATYTDANGIIYEITTRGAVITGTTGNRVSGTLEIPSAVMVNGVECPVREVADQALGLSIFNDVTSLVLPASISYIGSIAFLGWGNLTSITYHGTIEPQIMQNAFTVSATGAGPARVLYVPNASGGFTASKWGDHVTVSYGKGEGTHIVTFFKYYTDEGVPLQEIVVVENDHPLTKPADPTRPGYTFAGWYIDQNYTAAYDFTATKVFSSFTLYAKWTPDQQTIYTDENGIIYLIGSNGAVVSGHINNATTGSLIIPENVLVNGADCPVRGIDNRAFMNYNITTLILPASVNSIGSMAFYNCLNLTDITYNGTLEPQIGGSAFINVGAEGNPVNTTRTLNVPYASSGFTAANWGTNVTINYGGTASIHEVVFFHYYSDEGVAVADTIMVENDRLVTIPSDPVRQGYNFAGWYTNENYTVAFDFDTKVFSSFTLYAKWIVSDGSFVVKGIRYKTLSSVYAEVVGYNADYSPVSLTIPAEVTHGTVAYKILGVAEGAFFQCLSLRKVTIADGITYVKEAAFAASGVMEITLPASLLTIGTGAYRSCNNLTSVTFLGTTPPVNMVSGAGGSRGDVKRTLYVPNATEGFDLVIWDVDAIIYGGEPPVVEERTETSAVVTWSFVEDATFYYLYLYADASKETLIYTYQFDANGNLVDRMFRGISVVDRAVFDIGELESDKSYYIEVEAQNEGGDILTTQVSEIPTLENFSTSITTPSGDAVIVYTADGCIVIENLPTGAMYSIYTISGVQLFVGISSNAEAVRLPVSKGIYIVKTMNKTTKLIAR